MKNYCFSECWTIRSVLNVILVLWDCLLWTLERKSIGHSFLTRRAGKLDKKMESFMNIHECNSSSNSSESEQILNEYDLVPNCNDTIFLDMRGFRSSFVRFICKELCLIDSDSGIYHKFIKSTFPMNKLKYHVKYTHQLKVDYEQKFGHLIMTTVT